MEMTPRDRHWYELICQCRESGLTDKQWCMENDIHVSTFYRHARILKNLSCQIPTVGHKGQMQSGRQDVVPLQIIPELPAREPDAGLGGITLPDGPHPAETDVPYADTEEPGGSFSPVLKAHFPNGISIDISNLSSPSALDHVISSLARA